MNECETKVAKYVHLLTFKFLVLLSCTQKVQVVGVSLTFVTF